MMNACVETQARALEKRERFLQQISPDSQFHRLFDHLEGMHFFAKDRSGRMMFVSQQSLAHHGLKHEWEIVGKTDADLVAPHLAEAYVADDQWVFRTGQPLLHRVELWVNPQRVPDWYLTSKIPLFSREGDIMGIMGVLQSYEGRKRHLEPYLAIAEAVDYVGRNYDRSLRVTELARLCHMSVRQLERKFAQAFRMTPQQFIIHTRVQYACQAILQSRQSLSQIALECGFHDQSAFSREFRKHVGMTPRQYRQRAATNSLLADVAPLAQDDRTVRDQ